MAKQFKCRVCGHNKYTPIPSEEYYFCLSCSVMFQDPEEFSADTQRIIKMSNAKFGPIFEVGDKLVWSDNERPSLQEKEEGPFTVASIKENLDSFGPIQFVTVRNNQGKLLMNSREHPSEFDSLWFKKLE